MCRSATVGCEVFSGTRLTLRTCFCVSPRTIGTRAWTSWSVCRSAHQPPRAHSSIDELFVSGAVVLATCNRFEAYLDIDEPLTGGRAVAVESVVEAMASASGILPESLRASVAVHEGADAASHLFAVTSGLESVVVGEEEISGQVRRALDAARADGTTQQRPRATVPEGRTHQPRSSQPDAPARHASLARTARSRARVEPDRRLVDAARADRRHRPLRRHDRRRRSQSRRRRSARLLAVGSRGCVRARSTA